MSRSGRYVAIFGGSDSRYYHDGSHLIGQDLHDVLVKKKADWFLNEINTALESDGLHIVEYGLSASDIKGLESDGPAETIWFEGRVSKLNFPVNGEDAVIWVASNMTERLQLEKKLNHHIDQLKKNHSLLEERVAERTAELARNTERLQEANIALKVLLEKRREDQEGLEETIVQNIEKLIHPYLQRLQNRSNDDTSKTLLKIIQANLDEITSSFMHTQKNINLKLTPTQIQIADLIKQGKTTKEIAALLNLSTLTIARHRQDIRQRLGLKDRKSNLRSVLSFTKK